MSKTKLIQIPYLYTDVFYNEDTEEDEFKDTTDICMYNYDKKNLKRPHEIVIKDTKITIKIGYLLKKSFNCKFESKHGFTRAVLIRHIIDTFKKIYKDHSEANGKYDYTITNLFIEGIQYNSISKTVYLAIGS